MRMYDWVAGESRAKNGILLGFRNLGVFLMVLSGKPLLFSRTRPFFARSLKGMKISDIAWDSVRMVSINDLTLRITTEIGVLSLQGTKRVDDLDEARFNPARFLDCYKDQRRARALAAR
jgi:hypothetical protein